MVALGGNGCSMTTQIFWLMMITGLSANFKFPRAILLELCAELSLGLERDIASTNPSPNYAWFSDNRIIPEGIG